MDKSIGILDKDYTLWVKELVKRYRSSQIKAAIKVNRELLRSETSIRYAKRFYTLYNQ